MVEGGTQKLSSSPASLQSHCFLGGIKRGREAMSQAPDPVFMEASAFKQKMSVRFEALLGMPPVSLDVALKHAWNKDDM